MTTSIDTDTACDKCGRLVSPENNMWLFEAYFESNAGPIIAGAFVFRPRHLLPVTEDGGTVCNGSPSRAQYLEGQPRDSRVEYTYQPEFEARSRAAYDRMLAEV